MANNLPLVPSLDHSNSGASTCRLLVNPSLLESNRAHQFSGQGSVAEARYPKGLYKKARAGEIAGMTTIVDCGPRLQSL